MNYRTRKIKEVVDKDVVIIGGGPAGVGAAVGAARMGVDTLVIERFQCLGGMLSGGLVGTSIVKYRVQKKKYDSTFPTSYEGEQVIWGIPQDLLNRLLARGAAFGKKDSASATVATDPEVIKEVTDELVLESGAEIWLQSLAIDTYMEGNDLKGVIVANKSGQYLIRAKTVIDASGDGDVAAWAGADFMKGHESTGYCMPVSLMFIMGNVNLRKCLEYLKANPTEMPGGRADVNDAVRIHNKGEPFLLTGFQERLYEAHKNGDLPLASRADNPVPIFVILSVIKHGRILNDVTAHIVDMAYKVDATDAKDLTQAFIKARKRARVLENVLRRYIPGYENSYLVYTASQLGIRESRRIMGEYVLSKEDILNGRHFDDVIARCGGIINIHSEGGGSPGSRRGGQFLQEMGSAYDIPYRALVPQKVNNLLVSGRCISADRAALGSFRGTSVCMAIGQAAGVAAAVSAKSDVNSRSVDVKEVQNELINQRAL